MIIRPSAAIRQNYNEIAEQCRKTGEPVFLTKNGEGDLVVMDIETYVEEDRMNGNKGYSVEEVAAMMRSVIQEASNRGEAE